MATAPDRPVYSRADLDALKTLDRAGVFDALGSFDEAGMDDNTFILAAATLLDPARVDGLNAATRAGEPTDVLAAVMAAVRADAPPPPSGAALDDHSRELADAALAHRFCFYDEWHQLGEEIDWDHNPGTRHWAMDLNRFTFLSPLTQAYGVTGDGRYARKAVELMLDWVAKADWSRCFTGTPYVFGSYLNEAIHCPAWATCVTALAAAGRVEPMELLRIVKSLHDHLAYLEIVTGGHHGNWPTIGYRGILATLATLPVFRDTDRFVGHCVDGLAVQIDEQILPDGVQDELTPHYHRVVVSNLVEAAIHLRRFDRRLHPRTLAALGAMVHYMQQTQLPDGSGQVAFNDSDPDVAAAPILQRLRTAGLAALISPEADLGPELFGYAGVALLRQRPNDGDLYLAFDGGPFGRGHQHEDMLGFELFAYGRRFIGDPGRHLYDQSEVSFLPYLRSTRAHSTIRIDDAGQHARGRPDTWIATAPCPVAWAAGDDEVRAAASYTLGYGQDNAIVVAHHREIVFVNQRFWVVFDHVSGAGEHRIDSRFQFTPGPLTWDGSRAHTGFDDANLLLVPLPSAAPADVRIIEGRRAPRDGWYSSHYGRIEPAPALDLRARSALPWTCATLLWPYTGPTPPDLACTREGDTLLLRGEAIGEIAVAAHPPSRP